MLSYAFMRNAFAAGTASAIVAGLVGYFVVLRGSSFAAHAISHIGFAAPPGRSCSASTRSWGSAPSAWRPAPGWARSASACAAGTR